MYCYYFEIAKLCICIQSPVKIALQPCMLPFQKSDKDTYDVLYKIEWANDFFEKRNIIQKNDFSILLENNEFVRLVRANLSNQTFDIRMRKMKKNNYQLLIPSEMKQNEELFGGLNILDFLAVEDFLLDNQAFILHSSFIKWKNKGILFTAASGTGKSTQADLWKKYEGADIYNGDRTVLRKMENSFVGFGSPYAGSSKIYRNESVPIKAIVVLSQAPENRISRLVGKQAFLPLYRETLMNTWNAEYMENMTELLMNVVSEIPIYHLACRPDQGAVELVKSIV